MRNALITGAGSGIGRATAVALGNSGYGLALVGRRREPLEETADLTGSVEAMVISADVSDAADAARAVESAAEGLGGLDVLVNNAGWSEMVGMDAMTADRWDRSLAANASSAGYCAIAAWPRLKSRPEGGVIVNIASMAVYDPLDGFAAYGAAKAAMAHLTLSLSKEGARHGISAYCLCPGAVETAMLRSMIDTGTLPPDQTLPPERVAAVALACVRGERRRDNGRTIPVLPESALPWWRDWADRFPTGWLGMDPVR